MRDRPLQIFTAPSATGAALGARPGLAAALAARRFRPSFHGAPSWQAAARVLEVAPEGRVVVAGGDGTANLVATALVRAGQADRGMAVLPLGTGNAAAHALGVGTLRCALEALSDGREVLWDYLETSHPVAPVALISLSAGFEGAFLHAYARTRGASRLRAAGNGLRSGVGTRKGSIRVVVDGAVLAEGRAFNAGLYNLPRYAFGRRVWRDAVPDDGRAEAVVHRRRRAYLATLLRGRSTAVPNAVGDPVWSRWTEAEFATDGPLQVDGEAVEGGRTVRVSVRRRGLRLICARGSAHGRPGSGRSEAKPRRDRP